MAYILAYDIGTTGVKTCVFRVDDTITLIASQSGSYPLYVFEDGGAEQDGDDWWHAMCETTRRLMKEPSVIEEGIDASRIAGISFCSQMQGLVLADRDGVPVHRPMSYMDCRAKAEIKKGIANGIQIAGANIFKLIPSIIITGAVSSSVKDPVWKYKWVEAHEPENFSRAYKWLDVKDYLLHRCTGRFVMSRDSAFATLIYDTRKGRETWSHKMCSMFGIRKELLPEIIDSSDMVGPLTLQAATELGLAEGIPVFAGGGDSSLIGVGAGAIANGSTHIYWGTSGWVITVTDKQKVDAGSMIAAIVGARQGFYNYFAEMETAGKSLEWVKDHLALDEIGVYLDRPEVIRRGNSEFRNLYEYLTEVISEVPPGSGGVIFTPWLHGNRCPFEDPDSSGMFFNVKIETGKAELIRSVVEGICYHLRWMLECQESKLPIRDTVRFVGGGALSPEICRILADVTGKRIETVDSPQNVGSVGAAAVAGVGLGLIPDYEKVEAFIPVRAVYEPNMDNRKIYDKYYGVFREIYQTNKKLFKKINAEE